MENELFKLSSLNWVTSHSSWEVSKIKIFETNKWVIIVTDYHTWPPKHFWIRNHFGRQARNFIDTPQQVWLQHFWNIELQNSVLRDINNNGDNNEKKTNNLKNLSGYSRWEFCWWEFSGVGEFSSGECDWLEFSRWVFFCSKAKKTQIALSLLWDFLNRHVVAFFEESVLKEVRILCVICTTTVRC